jgi:hypothetical protein
VAVEQIVEDRVDLVGIGFEDLRPVERRKSIGERLSPIDVVDVGEDVVDPAVADVVGVELASEPLVAVDIDLDDHGKPGLDFDMDQTESLVQEVVVEDQTFAAR